jgi:hypothetical protein
MDKQLKEVWSQKADLDQKQQSQIDTLTQQSQTLIKEKKDSSAKLQAKDSEIAQLKQELT